MDAPWTVGKMLEWCLGYFTKHAVEPPRLCAEMLLSHVLGLSRIRLYTALDRVLIETELARMRGLVKRAVQQEPIQYLVGKAQFYTLDLSVDARVLIPRPDTETLVEQALTFLKANPTLDKPAVLDLCTGSGCVALAIAQGAKTALITAIELDPNAAAVAQGNIDSLGFAQRVILLQGDLESPLRQRPEASRFDLIVSNPPYIPTAAIASLDKNVRDYEPRLALDGGPDGHTFHRRIIACAPELLNPGGRLMMEMQFDQRESMTSLFDASPFDDIRFFRDLGKNDRIVSARLP